MKTYLDWSAYKESGMGDAYADIPKQGGDFAKAVAVCINSRQCETKGKGVMCPSYRVSDNPHLSTGGRVRLLKALLNGELPLDDAELAEAMDQCLGCKGCKRECENSVDMAQIKIEYLAQRHAIKPPSFRTRLFAHTPRWLHRLPWLTNFVLLRNRIPLLAWLGDWFMGITANRKLPLPAEQSFATPSVSEIEGQAVVLFVDTFSYHYDPQIAEAALTVLERAGYSVIVAAPNIETSEPQRPLCCGRSYLAHGMVEEARAEAKRTLRVLLPYAEAGLSIVGLEPACLLAIRDDYRALYLGEVAEKVANQAILFEEFIVREEKAGRFNLQLKPLPFTEKLLVHGHCHQKAVGAMKSMRRVLKLIPKLDFELIEASCCGMGGSFALESEHAEMAMAMAEDSLLPTIRANADSPLLANGFSCREQIAEGSGRRARHLVQLLCEASE